MSEKNELTIAEAVNQGLRQTMERNNNVVLLGEDIGNTGGVFRVTEGLMEEFGEERVMDTPLAESGIVGTSIGMSFKGIKPVAEIQFMGFIYPAVDQLFSHAARYRARTKGEYVPDITVRAPYGGGIEAPEHHSESTEAIFSHYPGLKVVIPSNPKDAKGMISRCIESNDPILFLEPKRIYRTFREEVDERYYKEKIDQARVTKEGNDVTVVSWGSMHRKIQKNLNRFDNDIELIDLRSISPIDDETLVNSFKKTGKCVIVQEAPKTCSVSSEITTVLQNKAFGYQEAPILRVTGPDVPYPLAKLEDYYLPSVDRIKSKIDDVINHDF